MKKVTIASFICTLFLISCGPSAEEIATKTAISAQLTSTEQSMSFTKTFEASKPKIGLWTGSPNVQFDVTEAGIVNFTITVVFQMGGSCTLSMMEGEIININSDHTIAFSFGEKKLAESNSIRGQFVSETKITGTYSKVIACMNGSQMVIQSQTNEGKWDAEWTK
jgi:hypothetical protein